MDDVNAVEILYVEDSPNDAELTLRALKKQKLGNRLHWVKDGAEALDFMFAEGAYSERKIGNGLRLILLDLKLPKVDGLQVLRMVKGDERTRTIPVVVLTSSREEQDVVESYRLGVNSYIVKPVDFTKFADAVSELGMYWVVMNQPPN